MRLTIATGILVAHALLGTSGESHSENSRVVDLSMIKKKKNKQRSRTNHPPHRTGSKARWMGASQHHDRHHGSGNEILVNRARLSNGKTFCDPSLPDADIGLLSCGLGYECIVDDVSVLGGMCMPSTSRQLQENKICILCPFSHTAAQANYGIFITDTESGYAGKTCLEAKYAAYYIQSVNASSCNAVALGAQAAGCCGPKCELCDRGSSPLFTSGNETLVVEGVVVPGYGDAATCQNLVMASYFMGSIDQESCPTIRQAVIEAGCCVPFKCYTCELGSYIPYSVNDARCDGLRPGDLTYITTTLSDESCLAATQLAEDKDCCIPRPIYDGCDVCGTATFYPENRVPPGATCEYAKSTLNDVDCEGFAWILVPFCCGPSLPPNDDAEVPSPTPVVDSAPTSPPSASLPMWSTGPVVVSMMLCLATSALSAGSTLLLEWN